jgi:hypothetical protein
MSKPAFCKKHNVQLFIQTSPRLADAIECTEYFNSDEIVRLKILSHGEIFEYKIDRTFVNELSMIPVDDEVILRDRDEKEKKLNDRLLIQKITRAMKWVCPVCLSEILTKDDKKQVGWAPPTI